MRWSTLKHTSTHCNYAVCYCLRCNTAQRVSTQRITERCNAARCNVLRCVGTRYAHYRQRSARPRQPVERTLKSCVQALPGCWSLMPMKKKTLADLQGVLEYLSVSESAEYSYASRVRLVLLKCPSNTTSTREYFRGRPECGRAQGMFSRALGRTGARGTPRRRASSGT
jgi:hypothetical protein